jgi:hypothetical protein
MDIKKIISSAVTGTTFMTAFSILVSRKADKQFREPVLLNRLLKRLSYKNEIDANSLPGWISHYAVGTLFTTVYDQIWQRRRPTLSNSLALGGISGLIGIAVWDLTFRLHPNPPSVDHKNYYKQLFVAHLIFGVFAAAGYRLAERKTPSDRSKQNLQRNHALQKFRQRRTLSASPIIN